MASGSFREQPYQLAAPLSNDGVEYLNQMLQELYADLGTLSSKAVVLVYGSAAPVSGTWKLGDRVYTTTPTAGGTEGWICTVAGTPGTWKIFGAIGV